MSVYGIGPPRSGTTMLAECLSVVRPVEHETARKKNSAEFWDLVTSAVVRCANDGTDFFYENAEPEVAWYLTFAKPADKTIHLWRPYEEWLDSMLARCWHALPEHRGRTCFVTGQMSWNLGSDDTRWVWQTYHRRALSLPNVYTVQPGHIDWRDLLDWLGWNATDEQVAEMYRIQATRPNHRKVVATA